MRKIITLLTMMTVSFSLFGECIVNITRTACPGQDSTSYSKCGGKQSCDKVNEDIEEEAECIKWATKNCRNKRYDVTRKKVNIAYFVDEDGNKKPLNGGADLCDKDNKEVDYIVKRDFPFYDKTECK